MIKRYWNKFLILIGWRKPVRQVESVNVSFVENLFEGVQKHNLIQQIINLAGWDNLSDEQIRLLEVAPISKVKDVLNKLQELKSR